MRFSQVCSLLLSITTIASTMVFQPVLAQSEQLDILRHDRGDGKSSVTIQNGEKIDVYLTSPSSNTTWLIPSSSKLSCVKDSDKPNEKVTCTASNLETTYHRVYIRALINNVSTNSVDIVVAGNQNQTSQSTQTTVAPASGPRVYNFKQYLSQTGQTAAQFGIDLNMPIRKCQNNAPLGAIECQEIQVPSGGWTLFSYLCPEDSVTHGGRCFARRIAAAERGVECITTPSYVDIQACRERYLEASDQWVFLPALSKCVSGYQMSNGKCVAQTTTPPRSVTQNTVAFTEPTISKTYWPMKTYKDGNGVTIGWKNASERISVGVVNASATSPADARVEGWIHIGPTGSTGSLLWAGDTVCDTQMGSCRNLSPGKYRFLLVSKDVNGNYSITWSADGVRQNLGNVALSVPFELASNTSADSYSGGGGGGFTADCTSPYVPYQGQCVDPIPACKNPPSNSIPSSCIDRIADGVKQERYRFECRPGYSKRGQECVRDNSVQSTISSSLNGPNLVVTRLAEDQPFNVYRRHSFGNQVDQTTGKDIAMIRLLAENQGDRAFYEDEKDPSNADELKKIWKGATWCSKTAALYPEIANGAVYHSPVIGAGGSGMTNVMIPIEKLADNEVWFCRFQPLELHYSVINKNMARQMFDFKLYRQGGTYTLGSFHELTTSLPRNLSTPLYQAPKNYTAAFYNEGQTVGPINTSWQGSFKLSGDYYNDSIRLNWTDTASVNYKIEYLVYGLNDKAEKLTKDFFVSNTNAQIPAEKNKRYRVTVSAYDNDGRVVAQKTINVSTHVPTSVPTTTSGTDPILYGNYEGPVEVISRDDAALFADIDLNTLAGRAAQYLGKMRISGGRPPECADCKPNFDGNTELNKAEFSKFGIIAQLGADFAFNSSATDIKVPWDVDTSAWYWTFLRECIIRGILKNNPDGSSRPAEMINTATALEIIKRLKAPNYTFDKALLNKADFWTDVTGTDWWTDAAAFAYEKNLLPHRMKTDGGKFRADSTLTRYETAVIFYQLANSQ